VSNHRKQNRKQNSLLRQAPRQLRPNIGPNRSKESSNSVVPGDQLILRSANINPNSGLASNQLDPFNTLPVRLNGRGNARYLFSNCKLPASLLLLLFLPITEQFTQSSTLLIARTHRFDQPSKKTRFLQPH